MAENPLGFSGFCAPRWERCPFGVGGKQTSFCRRRTVFYELWLCVGSQHLLLLYTNARKNARGGAKDLKILPGWRTAATAGMLRESRPVCREIGCCGDPRAADGTRVLRKRKIPLTDGRRVAFCGRRRGPVPQIRRQSGPVCRERVKKRKKAPFRLDECGRVWYNVHIYGGLSKWSQRGGLENRLPATARGFESHTLRQYGELSFER